MVTILCSIMYWLPGPHTSSFIKFLKLGKAVVMTSPYPIPEHTEVLREMESQEIDRYPEAVV